jgi:hypothetical protein
MVDSIKDMIRIEGLPSDVEGLGKYYKYELYNMPFGGKKTHKGTRYIIPLVNNSGQKRYIVGNSPQDVVDQFKVEHPNGWNESTMSFDDISSKGKVKKSAIETWVVREQKDMGDLPASAYPVASPPPSGSNPHTYVAPGQPASSSIDDLYTSFKAFLAALGIK